LGVAGTHNGLHHAATPDWSGGGRSFSARACAGKSRRNVRLGSTRRSGAGRSSARVLFGSAELGVVESTPARLTADRPTRCTASSSSFTSRSRRASPKGRLRDRLAPHPGGFHGIASSMVQEASAREFPGLRGAGAGASFGRPARWFCAARAGTKAAKRDRDECRPRRRDAPGHTRPRPA
jgi:hypothetical protein